MIFRGEAVAGEENGERRVLGQSVYRGPRAEIGASDTDDDEAVVFVLDPPCRVGEDPELVLRKPRQFEPSEHICSGPLLHKKGPQRGTGRRQSPRYLVVAELRSKKAQMVSLALKSLHCRPTSHAG